MKNSLLGKILRLAAIVLMGLTATFTLLGGVGTTCAAFTPEKFGEAMAPLIPYKWLYQVFVVVTLGIGAAGIWAVYALARGKPRAYVDSLVVLLAGAAVAGVHMAASYALRGKTAPTDVRLYFTLFTLAVFLLLRLPGVWNRVGFNRVSGGRGASAAAAGLSLFVSGIVALTTSVWAGPSHTFDGYNLVNVLQLPLWLGGGAMALAGLILLARMGAEAAGQSIEREVMNQLGAV